MTLHTYAYTRSAVGPYVRLNPLSPRDALKHHFTSLKTDRKFSYNQGFMSENFQESGLPLEIFFTFSLTSNPLH